MSETHVIVGAGQAGGWAAIGMRQAGFTGRILLLGDETWRPYERPPLSKAALTADAEPEPLYFHPADRYAELGIELMLGASVEAVLPKEGRVRLRDGRSLPYDRLLLATGGRARHLPFPGGEHALYLRTLEDARLIRARLRHARRVACIGAGVIGLELASSAHALGATVTVLEAAAAPMGRCVSPEGAAFVARLHRAAGVTLRVNVGRTSEPGIYAAGDVAAFFHPLYGRRIRLESWRHAQNHGLAVGKAMCGETIPYDDVPWFWTDQHGVNLQVAGLPAEAVHTVVRQDTAKGFAAVHLDADGGVVGVTAAGNPREIRAGTALIRAHAKPDRARLADPSVPLQSLL